MPTDKKLIEFNRNYSTFLNMVKTCSKNGDIWQAKRYGEILSVITNNLNDQIAYTKAQNIQFDSTSVKESLDTYFQKNWAAIWTIVEGISENKQLVYLDEFMEALKQSTNNQQYKNYLLTSWLPGLEKFMMDKLIERSQRAHHVVRTIHKKQKQEAPNFSHYALDRPSCFGDRLVLNSEYIDIIYHSYLLSTPDKKGTINKLIGELNKRKETLRKKILEEINK